MEGLDELEIKKAGRSHRLREKEQKEKQKAEEEEMRQMGGRPEIEKELAAMLKKGETVLEALQRLGAQAKKNGAPKRPCVISFSVLDHVADTCSQYEAQQQTKGRPRRGHLHACRQGTQSAD